MTRNSAKERLGRVAKNSHVSALAMVATVIGLAANASPANGAPVFGLDSATPQNHPPSLSEFQMMSAAGVKDFRALFFWPALQRTSLAVFDWSNTDALVENAARAGVRILPFFLGSPEWLTGCPTPISPCQHQPPVQDPSQENAWRRFLTAAVDRYGPSGQFWLLHPDLPQTPVTAWQIWNEPDLAGFVGGSRGVLREGPPLYAELLQISASAIREADPAATIVTAGLTPGPFGGPATVQKFLRRLYEQPGAKRDFDVVSLHPYATNVNDVETLMNRSARTIRAHDRDSRTWVTEIGWSSAPSTARHQQGATNLRVGKRRQAQLVRHSYRLFSRHARDWRLDRVYYFSWRDSTVDSPDAWSSTAGLRQSDLSPKPAWRSFRRAENRYGNGPAAAQGATPRIKAAR